MGGKKSPMLLPHAFLDAQEKLVLETLQNMMPTPSIEIAMLFSPYDFSVGGGEKYFLEAASFYQRKGYGVIIFTDIGNICKDKLCIHDVAVKLDVNLTMDFNYILLEYSVGRKVRDKITVEHYYEMGNSKYPQFKNPAKFGVYQCQFPFDGLVPGSEQNVQDLQTFDLVVVNSEYTKMNYLGSTKDDFALYQEKELPYPSIEVLNPPVSMLSDHFHTKKGNFGDKVTIAMLGRVFSGRQSKGHVSAIEAMRTLSKVTTRFELHIIGQVQPGYEDFATNLTKIARGLPIQFHLSVTRDEVRNVLEKSHFFWHLTGIDSVGDPASNEHFGISPVEAISLGLVPMHYDIGGVGEATGNCGILFHSVGDLVKTTLDVATMTHAEYFVRSHKCQEAARSFTVQKFHLKFERILVRNRWNRQFAATQLSKLPHALKNISRSNPNANYTAYIYVHSPTYHLPLVIRNVMGTLGPDWKLKVGVRPPMLEYIAPSFQFMDRVDFVEHQQLRGDVQDYSKMLMSVEFWDLFNTEHILIFQPDTILFYNNINYFVEKQLPFLGAPWCMENEVITQKIVSWNVGNGGLSLRQKSWMKKCVHSAGTWHEYNRLKEVHGNNSSPLSADNEDIFFNICVGLFSGRKQLTEIELEASRFAIEVPCEADFTERVPMGGHAVWFYMHPSDVEYLIEFGRKWTKEHR